MKNEINETLLPSHTTSTKMGYNFVKKSKNYQYHLLYCLISLFPSQLYTHV